MNILFYSCFKWWDKLLKEGFKYESRQWKLHVADMVLKSLGPRCVALQFAPIEKTIIGAKSWHSQWPHHDGGALKITAATDLTIVSDVSMYIFGDPEEVMTKLRIFYNIQSTFMMSYFYI